MTKSITIAALGLLAGATIASADTVSFADSPLREAGFTGGEFISNLSNGNSYRSFCLELNELITINPNQTYSYTIDTVGAMAGGVSGGNPDPVSSASASIFVAWLDGSIAQTMANSTAVQNAIWAIEGEVNAGSLSGAALALYNDAVANYSTTDNAITDNAAFSSIRVLNPYRVNNDGSIDRYQSQIILIPLPTASGMALAGLALVGTRRRR
jgi:hypothetical protein